MGTVETRNIIKYYSAKWLSFKILDRVPNDTKQSFRKLEKSQEKLTKKRMDIEFNKNCLQHNLLPNYTNVKLHDEAARKENFVFEFRRNLIQR